MCNATCALRITTESPVHPRTTATSPLTLAWKTTQDTGCKTPCGTISGVIGCAQVIHQKRVSTDGQVLGEIHTHTAKRCAVIAM